MKGRRGAVSCCTLLRFVAAALGPDEGADFRFRLRPNSLARLKAFDKATITDSQKAEAIGGKARLGQEFFDFGDEVLSHKRKIARFSVRVNARFYVQAQKIPPWYEAAWISIR